MAAEIRQGKKRKKKIEITGQKYNGLPYYIGRRLKKPQGKNIMACPIPYGSHKENQ